MFILDEVFIVDCSRVRGLSTLGHVCPHKFQAFKLRLCFLQISGIQTLPPLSSYGSGFQTSPLPSSYAD